MVKWWLAAFTRRPSIKPRGAYRRRHTAKITHKWAVKEKEPKSVTVNMIDMANIPPRLVTQSTTRAQGQTSKPNDDRVETVSEGSSSQSSKIDSSPRVQTTRSSSCPRTISSFHPRQFTAHMADDNNEDQEAQSNNREDP